MNLKETYNKIAKDWHKDHLADTWSIRGAEIFTSFLKPGSLVLDVGCGGGLKSRYLINAGLKVIGVDFSKKMIEIAKCEVPEGKFFVMDIRDVEKMKVNFDGIFMQAVLLHISKKEIQNILQKLLKKLNKNSYIYIATKEKKENGLEEEIKTEKDYGYEYQRFFSYFTIDELKNYLNNLGLFVVYENATPSGNARWIQIIANKL